MEKTYSQKLAGDFEAAGYILLIPASFGAFCSLGFLKSAPWLTLLVFAIFIAGSILLAGYRLHARNRLSAQSVRALWLASSIYNFLLFIPCAVFGLMMLPKLVFVNHPVGGMICFFIFATVTLGYFTAGQSSMKAYLIEREQGSLLRNEFLRGFDRIEVREVYSRHF